MQHFHSKIKLQPSLTRQLVSFQANKPRPSYRWYKYKEAFSASLIEYLLSKYGITSGKVLDPFAGSGTTLFAASAYGLDAEGIELLSIGQQIISARKCLEREFTKKDFTSLNRWITAHPWHKTKMKRTLPSLRITDGAILKKPLTPLSDILEPISRKMSMSGWYYGSSCFVYWSQSALPAKMGNIFAGIIGQDVGKGQDLSIKVTSSISTKRYVTN